MAPTLTDVDLRPYFFFSRDKLGAISGATQRMSAPAQEVLNRLCSDSKAVRSVGCKEGQSLSAAEASSIFDAIRERTTREEDHGDENSALFVLFEWCGARRELVGQLITFLEQMPEKDIPPVVVPRLQKIAKNTEFLTGANALISRWSKSVSKPLAISAAGSEKISGKSIPPRRGRQ